MDSWGAIESDFQRFYKVDNPLQISWRRFNILLFNLISQESAFFAPFIKEAQEEAKILEKRLEENNKKIDDIKMLISYFEKRFF